MRELAAGSWGAAPGCRLSDTDGNAYIDAFSLVLVQRGPRSSADRPRPSAGAARARRAHDDARPRAPARSGLGQRLVAIAPAGLARVFYSDDGSDRHRGRGLGVRVSVLAPPRRAGARRLHLPARRLPRRQIGSVSVGGIDLFHPCFGPCCSTHGRPSRATPGTWPRCWASMPAGSRRSSSSRSCRARPGSSRTRTATSRRPRAVRRARSPADLRRGGDRLRGHRNDVRVRAGGRLADLLCVAKGLTGG